MDVPNRDRLFVALDEPPAAQLSRLAFGSAVVPLWTLLAGDGAPGWTLVPFFLFSLAMLRVAPLGIRMVVPFADGTKSVWAARRQLAKRYDSYQWQKMLWIGLGMLASSVMTGERGVVVLSLAAICVVSGAAGAVVWRRRNMPIVPGDARPQVLRAPAQCN
jgi:hypothetical protein